MQSNRRKFMKTSVAIGMVGFTLFDAPFSLAEWSAERFAPGGLEDTLKHILNGKPVVESNDLVLTIPEIAENGALVPVTVETALPDIRKLAIIVEENPVPLVIQAQLTPALEPFLSARLKMAKSSFVYFIAESEKVCYSVKKKVKVTIGGCGG